MHTVDEAQMGTTGLDLADLPATFRVADAEATRAEGRFLGIVRGEVALPLVGVAAGVTAIWVPSVGVVTVIAVAFVVLLRLLHRNTHSDATWYELRASAEAIKSVAWCYSVRAAPFDPAGSVGGGGGTALPRAARRGDRGVGVPASRRRG